MLNSAANELISPDNYDIVSTNLKQLDAMLDLISGQGFENFNQMDDDAKSWYLFNISSLSNEALKAINAIEVKEVDMYKQKRSDNVSCGN